MSNKQIRKCVRKTARWWIHWLGLGDWTIDINYKKKIKGGKKAQMVNAFRVFTQWEYKYAVIQVSYSALKKRRKKEIERLIVHELTHCLVNEMQEDGIKHEERVVTNLTNAFIWVRNETREVNK